uniref:Uncharacterized protein n=1 Tax=Anguilla anguilla TaxID=7936 RepID=A0A0E9U2K9_ANGAN
MQAVWTTLIARSLKCWKSAGCLT